MGDNHDFLDPVFSFKTLDVFWGRREILKALTAQLDRFEGTVLDLGCGQMPYRSLILSYADRVQRYIGMDLRSDLRDYRYANCGPPDLEWDGKIIPLESGSVGCIIATEVLHQCADVEVVLKEAARVLQPGGFSSLLSHFFGHCTAPRSTNTVTLRLLWNATLKLQALVISNCRLWAVGIPASHKCSRCGCDANL